MDSGTDSILQECKSNLFNPVRVPISLGRQVNRGDSEKSSHSKLWDREEMEDGIEPTGLRFTHKWCREVN